MKTLQLSAEDLAKVQKAKQRREKAQLEPEWLLLAEFGYYFGFDAVKSAIENEIDFDQLAALTQGARKVWYSKVIDMAIATQAGTASANSKKPKQTLEKALKFYMKEVK